MDKQDAGGAGGAGAARLDDPWYDALASGWGEVADEAPQEAGASARGAPDPGRHQERAREEGQERAFTPPRWADVQDEPDPAGGDQLPLGQASLPSARTEGAEPVAARERPPGSAGHGGQDDSVHAAVYLAVQRSAAFQEVRRRYLRFVVPATALFLTWYLGYVLLATMAPALMAYRVIGSLNVALLAGLGQFATTFLLTWAYARNARLRRDRAALDIRWETQELTGGNLR